MTNFQNCFDITSIAKLLEVPNQHCDISRWDEAGCFHPKSGPTSPVPLQMLTPCWKPPAHWKHAPWDSLVLLSSKQAWHQRYPEGNGICDVHHIRIVPSANWCNINVSVCECLYVHVRLPSQPTEKRALPCSLAAIGLRLQLNEDESS